MSSSDSDEYDPGQQAATLVSDEKASLSGVVAPPHPAPSRLLAKVQRRDPNPFVGRPSNEAQPPRRSTEGAVIHPEERRGVPTPQGSVGAAGEQGLRLRGMKGRVRCVCLSPSAQLLCAGGEDGQLLMWDFTLPLVSRRIEPTRVLTPFVNRIAGYQPIVALHAAVDGSYWVACQDGDSPALIASGGKQLGYCAIGERGMVNTVQCKGHRAPVTSSSPHATAAGGFYTGAQDGTARLWDQSSYERRSVYAVKHGSGQIDDVVIVESILSLTSIGGGGSVFATGAQDGCVQLWDSRVKYRPGGSVALFDMYAPQTPSLCGVQKVSQGDEFVEKHVGGMAELTRASDGTETAPMVLAVRRDTQLQFVDLRQPFSSSKGGSAGATAHSLRPSPRLFGDTVTGLPFVTDTTPVVATQDGFLTCTGRGGFRHVVGGHVVHCGCVSSPGASRVMPILQVWRAGRPDEDVLCVCADAATLGSGVSGGVFAGLNSGDVVVQTTFSGSNRLDRHDTPFWRWLSTRPEREKGPDKTEGRFLGQKFGRIEDDEGELLY